MADNAMTQVRALVAELLDAAKRGTLIPVRLPAQLEQIDALLSQIDQPMQHTHAEPQQPEAIEAVMQANAKFVSHAVHELRTPMTSIRGYSDMLGNPALGALTDMQRQMTETIRANARRMDSLLTDVSDMAKLRGGALRMSVRMDMFKNIAMQVEKTMAPTAEQLGRTLTFDIPSGLPLLETDGDLLAKAINKLVENGLRYHDGEGGSVTVRARAEGNALLIEVEDDGFGIAPEDFARLGEVYFRSEDERVRAHKGSGLGIPVAYGIIQLLGGTIQVKTAAGTGTTCQISLRGMG